MIDLSCRADGEFIIAHPRFGLTIAFRCSAKVEADGIPASDVFSPWAPAGEGAWQSTHDATGVVQRVKLISDPAAASIRIHHSLRNPGRADVRVHSLRTVTGRVEFAHPPVEPGYLHSLNVLHGLNPLAPLHPGKPSIPLGRVTYLFFEGLVLWQGDHQPCLVTGPLTQNLVHRCQQLTWDGDRAVALHTEQELRGIRAKIIPAGATLELDGVFMQVRAEFDANAVFTDYLAALREANGTRWGQNPLRREHFHAPWNNYLYWEATEDAILATARDLRRDFPGSVPWMGVDDGYQRAWVQPKLARRPDGELDYDYNTELIWYRNCPGVSFGFTEGLGEDRAKFPRGLLALAREIKALGLRPMLWLGLEISIHHPLYKKHPEWFLTLTSAGGEHALLDVSVPAVREQIELVFRTYYGAHGWQAVKLDFWSQLFERPDLRYREGNRTAAEWRRWFFEMIRRHLPADGFINLGCDLAMGAPWVAPWADSYRFSMDMRDGDWENVKSNIRWSLVPSLTHGFEQPIGDCDSVSIFKGLAPGERTCWADYAHQTGSIIEISGNLAHWTDADRAWLRAYLDEPRGGRRFWFGDAGAWRRDGLPRVVCRERAGASSKTELIVSLHNWTDGELALAFRDWSGPARIGSAYEDLRSGESGRLDDGTVFHLPPRSSRLLRIT